MVFHTPHTDVVFLLYVYVDGFVSNCLPWTFYCNIRNDNSFRRYEFFYEQLTSISARNLCHSIHIDIVSVLNGYWSNDISDLPIVENVYRILHICTVYLHYEVVCEPKF